MRVAIRCHPCAPAALTEVETWLECEVERMRDELPDAMQSRRFDTVLGEMRLLGLQPDVLARRVRL